MARLAVGYSMERYKRLMKGIDLRALQFGFDAIHWHQAVAILCPCVLQDRSL